MPMAKKKVKGDVFAQNQPEHEYDKPQPLPLDPDAARIAAMLSKINGRETSPSVTCWKPRGLPKGTKPFGFYFIDDKLAVDFFNRDKKELDALEDDLTGEQQQEVAEKTLYCSQNGLAYIHIGPDDELDALMLAAKIGKANFKKGARPERPSAKDGITEEVNDEF